MCVQALLVIGGFEAYLTLLQLGDAREAHPELCVPMACIPATISNNVPGTGFSLGCDTAVNEITEVRRRERGRGVRERERGEERERERGREGGRERPDAKHHICI